MVKTATVEWFWCPVFGVTPEPHGDGDCGSTHYPVAPEVAGRIQALASRASGAQKDYERAQRRTFELAERLQQEREANAPLRELLGEVLRQALGESAAARPPEGSIWHRAQQASLGLWPARTGSSR